MFFSEIIKFNTRMMIGSMMLYMFAITAVITLELSLSWFKDNKFLAYLTVTPRFIPLCCKKEQVKLLYFHSPVPKTSRKEPSLPPNQQVQASVFPFRDKCLWSKASTSCSVTVPFRGFMQLSCSVIKNERDLAVGSVVSNWEKGQSVVGTWFAFRFGANTVVGTPKRMHLRSWRIGRLVFLHLLQKSFVFLLQNRTSYVYPIEERTQPTWAKTS